MFKKDWEHPHLEQSLPSQHILKTLMNQGIPDLIPESFDPLSGGNRNLNLRVHGKDSSAILRLYLNDPKAGVREKNIYDMLRDNIPVPQVFYTGMYDGISFSILEDMPGISLRDFLLNHNDPDFQIMESVGELLSSFQRFPFDHAGFFDETLNINIIDYAMDIKAYGLNTLQKEPVQRALSTTMINAIVQRIENTDFTILEKNPHFTHGDFGPENILVTTGENGWEISALLDTEFSFSGSFLQDIANMMRYAHKMPKAFETQFFKGLSITLPNNWESMTETLNILALLDILSRHTAQTHPKMFQDVQELVTHFMKD